YIRRWYGNFTTTDNLLRTREDYEPYCVTAPADPRLPGGGGNQICGFYDVIPTKFSATTNNLVTFVKNYGEQSEVYNGLDLILYARLENGVLLSGGLNTGRTAFNNCVVVDSPQATFAGTILGTAAGSPEGYCRITQPFLTQVKPLGAYTLPWWSLRLSGTLQSMPGAQIFAQWDAPVLVIIPQLGRRLSGNVRTATVQLIKPGTVYGDRLTQVDFRVARSVALPNGRSVQVMFDLYNSLNADPVLTQNNTYGQQWQVPLGILS